MCGTVEDHVVRIAIKVRFWVNPFIYAMAFWHWLGGRVDHDWMRAMVSHGIVPVVEKK